MLHKWSLQNCVNGKWISNKLVYDRGTKTGCKNDVCVRVNSVECNYTFKSIILTDTIVTDKIKFINLYTHMCMYLYPQTEEPKIWGCVMNIGLNQITCTVALNMPRADLHCEEILKTFVKSNI